MSGPQTPDDQVPSTSRARSPDAKKLLAPAAKKMSNPLSNKIHVIKQVTFFEPDNKNDKFVTYDLKELVPDGEIGNILDKNGINPMERIHRLDRNRKIYIRLNPLQHAPSAVFVFNQLDSSKFTN
jgi:hypothetical protein